MGSSSSAHAAAAHIRRFGSAATTIGGGLTTRALRGNKGADGRNLFVGTHSGSMRRGWRWTKGGLNRERMGLRDLREESKGADGANLFVRAHNGIMRGCGGGRGGAVVAHRAHHIRNDDRTPPQVVDGSSVATHEGGDPRRPWRLTGRRASRWRRRLGNLPLFRSHSLAACSSLATATVHTLGGIAARCRVHHERRYENRRLDYDWGCDATVTSASPGRLLPHPIPSTPHNDMHRRRRESHGWRGLLRSGRVVGSREDGDSSTATGLVRLRVQTWVALATANGQACE